MTIIVISPDTSENNFLDFSVLILFSVVIELEAKYSEHYGKFHFHFTNLSPIVSGPEFSMPW